MDYQNPTLEECEETYKMGWLVTHDADSGKVLYCTNCNRCDKEFWSEKIEVYCDECKDTNKRWKEFIDYYTKHPSKAVCEMLGIKLKWWQRLYINLFVRK
jgi:hypothetical protein